MNCLGLIEARIDAILGDPEIDQLCMMLMTVLGKHALNGARALAAAAARHNKPVLVFSSAPRGTAAEAFDVLREAAIPVLTSPSSVAKAAAALAWFAAERERAARAAQSVAASGSPVLWPRFSGALSEKDSKAFLAACGLRVSRDLVLAPGADAAALDRPGPFAVKVVSPDIPHKIEIGGVRLDVDRPSLHGAVPRARIEGVMVSEMINDGVEALIGVVNGSVFGPVVAFGLDGIFAEVLKDVAHRAAPFDRDTACGMLSELRGRAIFEGVRGKPALDAGAVVDALLAVS